MILFFFYHLATAIGTSNHFFHMQLLTHGSGDGGPAMSLLTTPSVRSSTRSRDCSISLHPPKSATSAYTNHYVHYAQISNPEVQLEGAPFLAPHSLFLVLRHWFHHVATTDSMNLASTFQKRCSSPIFSTYLRGYSGFRQPHGHSSHIDDV